MLLDAGARSDSRSSSGDTALHCAARQGLEPIAQILMDSPALAVNASNIDGETPLHLAMSAGSAAHARIARALLAAGAFAFGRTSSGETVLHACAREGNVALAALILTRQTRASVDALNARAHHGGTALHVAVAHSQAAMVKLLLAQSALDRGVINHEGNTAVHVATLSGDVMLLQRLLSSGRGVEPSELTVRNTLGFAPLHTAALRGQDSTLALLLQWQAPVDQPTSDGWTALQLAASEGHLGATRTLLAAHANVDAATPSGECALGLAAARGQQTVLAELLRVGASPTTASDPHGWTPMHAALAHAQHEASLMLLERGGQLLSRSEPPPPVGDPIQYVADECERVALLDAEDKRNQRWRDAGRDPNSPPLLMADGLAEGDAPTDGGPRRSWKKPLAVSAGASAGAAAGAAAGAGAGTLRIDPLAPWPREERVALLLPSTPYLPTRPKTAAARAPGYFGYFGDTRDMCAEVREHRTAGARL